MLIFRGVGKFGSIMFHHHWCCGRPLPRAMQLCWPARSSWSLEDEPTSSKGKLPPLSRNSPVPGEIHVPWGQKPVGFHPEALDFRGLGWLVVGGWWLLGCG